MPNWCSNTLTITGDYDTLVQLKPIIDKDEDGLLEAIAPIGEWDYGTAVETWGTKWDVSTEGLDFTDNGDGTATIQGYMDSAWVHLLMLSRSWLTTGTHAISNSCMKKVAWPL